MKTNLKVILLMVVLSICSILMNHVAKAQQFKDNITKELAFESTSVENVFYLANINGSIIAEGYDGTKIILEAEKTINAKTSDRLEKARSELEIGIIDRYDTLIVYIKGACGKFERKKWDHEKERKGWRYNWNDCHDKYDFKYTFKLKIPQDMNVYLSTINDGDIVVTGMHGTLDIRNVNGSISLDKVSNKTYAHTINGDVHLDYKSLPSQASYYYTLNGDIEAFYPKGLRADMTFKSYNGDFYTNVNSLVRKPSRMKKMSSVNNNTKLKFKLDGTSVMSAGGGGVELAFETFNGDVYVREK